MVRCTLGKQPTTFDEKVRKPGLNWLKANPGFSGRPPSYWTRVLDDLSARFKHRCAYLAHELGTVGTVDHFLSVKASPKRAYQWSNYRHAVGWINSKKQSVPAKDILDPVVVGKGWFELHYPSLHLRVGSKCPKKYRKKAEYTLTKLGLDKTKRVVTFRTLRLKDYLSGGMDLATLRRHAPLVAEMVEREGLKPKKSKKA